MPEAYVCGSSLTHPPVALQGGDLLRQLGLNTLHDNCYEEKGESEKCMMMNGGAEIWWE